MILLDSNIVIYSAQSQYAYLRPLVSNPENCVSSFTMLEVLGFPALLPVDKTFFQSAFSILEIKEISQDIINQAIILKQKRKMSPGDAVIASTALLFNLEIYTRNISDFNWIDGLRVINPL